MPAQPLGQAGFVVPCAPSREPLVRLLRAILRAMNGRARTSSTLLLLGGLLAACGAQAPHPHPAGTEPAAKEPAGLTTAGSGEPGTALVAGAPPCQPGPLASTPSERARAAALEALHAGQLESASRGFEEIVRSSPRDLGAQALARAARQRLLDANRRAAAEADRVEPVRLASLPLAAQSPEPLALGGAEALTVAKLSEKANLITDDADWLARVGVAPPSRRLGTMRGDDTPLPAYVAASLRGIAPSAIYTHPDHVIVVYGQLVGVYAEGRSPRVFDLRQATRPPSPRALELVFAQLVGDVLILQLAYNGYAKDAGGKNAYVAAFDAKDGRLRWSSDALVANSNNFVVSGSRLVTGYGFTAEPDALFVLDLATGKTAQKLPLKSGPDFILPRGDELHVRTYDTDYVFRLQPGARPAPAASLAPARRDERPAVTSEQRCFVDASLAAIDRRDADALAAATDGLARAGGDPALHAALDGVRRFLDVQSDTATRRIDLSTVDPVVVAAPPWAYALARSTTKPRPAGVKLTRTGSARVDPVAAFQESRKPPRPGEPAFIAPVEQGKLPPTVRQDIPSKYAGETLRAIVPSGDSLLLVYGGRYLAIVEGSTTTAVLDLEAFRHPPAANPQWKEFAIQDLTYAQVVGRTLYVAHGGGSYAREVYGKKGYMSAIDLDSKKLLWRSDPLVVGHDFAIEGELIVTGYGFTDEIDKLFVLWRETGEKLAESRLDSAPSRIRAKKADDRVLVHVIGYDQAYDYEITSPDLASGTRR